MRFEQMTKTLISAAGTAVALSLLLPAQASADKFQTCVSSLWPPAKAAGVTRATFEHAFAGLSFDPEVVELATYQPEYVKPVGEYVDRAVSEKRINIGKEMLVQHKALLDRLEARYGVDRHVIVAIWGVESNYGTQPGDKNVIRSLATLICSGTKSKFARSQLNSALKILQRGDVSLEAMNGSWAGAMGHTQFIPTTYSAYAADYDGDGKRDIWGNVPDALASTASYLKVSKWQPGQSWGYEVRVPKGVNPKRISESSYKTLGEWQRIGFVRANGQPYPRPGDRATLFSPEGTRGPSFLVLNNFRSILRYNQAKSYALGVGHLSDRLRGGGPFVQPWPSDETHLSLDQRHELQKHLIDLGMLEGEPDGVIGRGTLEAVRTYQRTKGLQVDGYPTLTILKRLRAEAPARPPAQPANPMPQPASPTPQPASPTPQAGSSAAQPPSPAAGRNNTDGQPVGSTQ
ncbi:MAG: lytic murein transglycosylase [Methyloceanibacter sp.]